MDNIKLWFVLCICFIGRKIKKLPWVWPNLHSHYSFKTFCFQRANFKPYLNQLITKKNKYCFKKNIDRKAHTNLLDNNYSRIVDYGFLFGPTWGSGCKTIQGVLFQYSFSHIWFLVLLSLIYLWSYLFWSVSPRKRLWYIVAGFQSYYFV